MQIILSEILDVPTTIETGTPDAKISLYDTDNRFDYGNSLDLDSLVNCTNLGGDCSKASREPENYATCAHIVPEVW